MSGVRRRLAAIEIVYRVMVPFDQDIESASLDFEWVRPDGTREAPLAEALFHRPMA